MNLKEILRVLIWCQLFLLMGLIFVPTVLRWLPDPAGKVIYALEVAVAIALAVLLRRALGRMDRM